MDLKTLFSLAEEPDIIAVANSCCNLQLTRRGPRYQCLCPNPYHHDKHMGSFSINPTTKLWGCFACDLGQHHGNVSLVSVLRDISRVEAAVEICLAFGSIAQSEASSLLKEKPKGKRLYLAPAYTKSVPAHVQLCKPAEVLDIVYRSFIEASPKMSPTEQEALIETRHLTPEDMKDFFVLPPKSQAFWAAFKSRLAENGQAGTLNDILTGIPGFMRYAGTKRWSFMGRVGCLCLISRNVAGQIIGFQMRLPDGAGAKYISFSSGSVDGAMFDRCCSGGVLVDVIPPKNKPSKVIAITEGKFKAITLSNMGVWAVSIAGVGNWRYVIPVLLSICKALNQSSSSLARISFMICFDADMKTNWAVAKSAKELAKYLIRTCPADKVYFADWDLECGKGIDDVVNAGNQSSLRRYEASKYLQRDFFKDPVNIKGVRR